MQAQQCTRIDQLNPADHDFHCDLYEDIIFELMAYSLR